MGQVFESARPIWTQLSERLRQDIVSGRYPPGARLDSVRELAAAAGVNPNTMQRALAALEQEGLVRTERTAGRFVTEDAACIAAARQAIAAAMTDEFVQKMARLGYTAQVLCRPIGQPDGQTPDTGCLPDRQETEGTNDG